MTNKHLTWVIGLVLIVSIVCGTLIYINNNSWTMRFEMDNNTREAIQSIEYPIVDNSNKTYILDECNIWHGNGTIETIECQTKDALVSGDDKNE